MGGPNGRALLRGKPAKAQMVKEAIRVDGGGNGVTDDLRSD